MQYKFGTVIRPSVLEPLHAVFAGGWALPEPGGFCWLDGAAGRLDFDVGMVAEQLMLEIDCFPVHTVQPTVQRIAIYVNSMLAGNELLLERRALHLIIPRELCHAATLRIDLVPAVVDVPKLSKQSNDERVLSIGVYSVSLRATKALR